MGKFIKDNERKLYKTNQLVITDRKDLLGGNLDNSITFRESIYIRNGNFYALLSGHLMYRVNRIHWQGKEYFLMAGGKLK